MGRAPRSTKASVLSFLTSLAVVSGQTQAAEGYLLELVAWCAFSDQTEPLANN